MANVTFEQLQAESQSTADTQLNVAVSANNPMPPGVHTFELVVTDSSGLPSVPAKLTILVRDTRVPTAVPQVLGANGQPLPRDAQGNILVEFGASIILDGGSSTDPGGGSVARYTWRLVSQ